VSLWALAVLAASAWFALVNLLGSMLARTALPGVERQADAASRARGLVTLRLLPSLTSLVLVAGLVVPAFWMYEPRDAEETPGLAMILLASAGIVSVVAGLRRSIGDLLATRRLRRAWEGESRAVGLPDAPAPARAIRHSFPVVSVVGILRPRLFVAERVLERLSPSELAAVVAHEAGHLASLDNLKRLAMRLAPVMAWPGLSRRVVAAWDDAAEEAADASVSNRLELASALVKTARLVPAGSRLDLPVAAFHRGDSIGRRVRLLTEMPEAAARTTRRWPAAVAYAVAVAVLVAVAASELDVVHQLIEPLVHLP
jgi:Zn-dependent protease with chaperone function